jgi:hypothetical protein
VIVASIFARLFSALRLARRQTFTPTLTEAEVCRVAQDWAQAQELRWLEPVGCRFEPATRMWEVQSNALGKGFSVRVTVDDASGIVVAHHVLPR